MPAPLSCTNHYVASLGHKANHHRPNNAEYARCFHPRFGEIKCIRAIRDIEPDEEITVDYGYSPGSGPAWYRASEKTQPAEPAKSKRRR